MSDGKRCFEGGQVGKGAGNGGLQDLCRVVFGLFVVFGGANNVYAGGPFDYVGYTAASLLENIARELSVEKEVHIHRSKSDSCNSRSRCTALTIVAPFEKSGFLEKAVIALAKPCAYSRVHAIRIKNPNLASAKTSPQLDGKSVFCGAENDEGSIVLHVTDSTGVFGHSPMTIIVKRNEKID